MRKVGPLRILMYIAISIGVGIVSCTDKMVILGLVILVPFVILFIFRPRIAFLLLLLTRPSVDVFRNLGLRLSAEAILNVNAVFVALIIMLGVFFFMGGERSVLKSNVSRVFLVYLFILLFWGIVISQSKEDFIAGFLRLLSFFVIFNLSFYLFDKEREIKKLITVCFYSSMIPLSIALSQFVTGGAEHMNTVVASLAGINRIYGTFAHPGSFAIYLVLLLNISFGIFFTRKNKSEAVKWMTLILIFSSFLVLTYFRSAWIGLFVSLLLIGIIKYRKVLFLIPIAISLFIWVNPHILQRLSGLSSWDWRLRLWERLLLTPRSTLDYLFGGGLGSTAYLIHNRWGMAVTTAHNTYIRFFLETGVFGLSLFLMIKILLLGKAYKLIMKDNPEFIKAMSVGMFGMCISLFVIYVGQTVTGPVIMWYFWAFAGAFCALEYQIQKMETSNSNSDSLKREAK